MPHPARNTQTVSNAKLPDVLRLSDLRELCNVLNLRAFVGRIRRLRLKYTNNPKRRALRRFFCLSSRINSASQFIRKINLKTQIIIQ